MANDNSYDDSDISLDEEDPGMSEEERRQKQAEAEFEQRLAEEEARLGAARASGQPTGQGRMYMGPTISQQQFNRIPVGGNINLAGPPVTAPTDLERLQAADRPGTRTIAVQPPGMPAVTDINFDLVQQAMQARRKYEAQLALQNMLQSGVPLEKALPQSGAAIFGATAPTKTTTAGGRVYDVTGGVARPLTPSMPTVHYGTRGEVLSTDAATGSVKVLRPPDAAPTKPSSDRVEIPEDEFGPKITGSADSPEIKRRVKLMMDKKAAEAAPAAGGGFWRDLGSSLGLVGASPAAPVSPPTQITGAPAPTTKEIRRKTKDGRIAIFDADTKQFLRYAD